ncbi:MAG: hypothetical protein RBR05_01815 [Candidatus Methanomethylophilaceae archaeon]|nr:hypothetical protein [Candidatus Methanomethylophilaceae archaeon]MDD3378669.1 hypothetical protein [Candidatus Methanomethylophilaceae archaeon]MDY0224121.1 hypothetical protein [Candidatus Methanomethylophilaceae archaeon]
MNNDRSFGSSIPSTKGHICTLDNVSASSFLKIYCSCGRIIGLDKSEMKIKMKLGKSLECVSCRNARISRELDALDKSFYGVEEEDTFCDF